MLGDEGTVCVEGYMGTLYFLLYFLNICFSGECIGHWVILLTSSLQSNNYRELKEIQQQKTDTTRSHLQICQSPGTVEHSRS